MIIDPVPFVTGLAYVRLRTRLSQCSQGDEQAVDLAFIADRFESLCSRMCRLSDGIKVIYNEANDQDKSHGGVLGQNLEELFPLLYNFMQLRYYVVVSMMQPGGFRSYSVCAEAKGHAG